MTIMIAMLPPVPSVPVQGRSRVLLAMARVTILAVICALVALLVVVTVFSHMVRGRSLALPAVDLEYIRIHTPLSPRLTVSAPDL